MNKPPLMKAMTSPGSYSTTKTTAIVGEYRYFSLGLALPILTSRLIDLPCPTTLPEAHTAISSLPYLTSLIQEIADAVT